MMRGLETGVELLSYSGPDLDGYMTALLAVDGVRAGAFSFPAAHLDGKTEEWLGGYLSRQAREMLTRYGVNGLRPEATEHQLLTNVA